LEVLRHVGFYGVKWRVDARGANAGYHVEKLDRELHEVRLGCPYLLLASWAVCTVPGDREVDSARVLRAERLVYGNDLLEDRQELYGRDRRHERVELAEHRLPAERGAFFAAVMRRPCVLGNHGRVLFDFRPPHQSPFRVACPPVQNTIARLHLAHEVIAPCQTRELRT
jgi:hypothetical protein